MIPDGFDRLVRIGSGGLGDVYRARRVSTDTIVAIKELHTAGTLQDRERRVTRELRALASLRGHPNVINLEEVVRSGDELLLVMEYSPGGSLDDRARACGGHLPLAEVVLVGQHAAAGLRAAHDAGIVHRDIKPQNLLVGAYGTVKVCDFGIASVAGTDAATKTDAVSYRFASPEELRGDATVSSAVDVYSLGVTLAKLLTNRYFTHETAMHLVNPGVTPGRAGPEPGDAEVSLRSLVRRCLARRPGDRPSASDVEAALDRIAGDLGDERIARLEPVELTDRIEEPVDTAAAGPSRAVVRGAWGIAAAAWVAAVALAVVYVVG